MRLFTLLKGMLFRGYIYWVGKKSKTLYPHNGKKSANIMYRLAFHRDINWENPRNLIEKIYWLQLNTDTSMWSMCADKYKMREYVESKGYGDNLPKLYGHWYDVDSIDFNSLPQSFVLKINNGCGTVIIVEDKNKINIKEIKTILHKWIKEQFGFIGAQYHYLRIQPCFIAEELLHQDKTQSLLSPHSLIDYKVYCINGKAESIWVAFNRHNAINVNMALYDTQWNDISKYLKNTTSDVYVEGTVIPKPGCLEEMLRIANDLAKPFYEVRVDFYIVGGKPVVGELTFTSGYGFFTEEYYEYLGEKIIIKKN